MSKKTIDIGQEFTRFPAGRDRSDGEFSGEAFREDYLAPSLKNSEVVEVELDGPIGFGSSFLEEAFGGLVRVNGFTLDELTQRLVLNSKREILKREIWLYIQEASDHKQGITAVA